MLSGAVSSSVPLILKSSFASAFSRWNSSSAAWRGQWGADGAARATAPALYSASAARSFSAFSSIIALSALRFAVVCTNSSPSRVPSSWSVSAVFM
jgi:hypothetical protein